MKRLELHINGLVIEKGARMIVHRLRSTHGVHNVCVDTVARTTIVEHDENRCTKEDLLKAITGIGYQVDALEEQSTVEV
jgi:cation transport ATPase